MRKGLGRGLDAILGSETAPVAVPEAAGSGSRMVGVASLVPNRFQPRSDFDDEGLDELASSIKAQGVIQPLVVSARGDGAYTIIAGERRWRAAQKAGLTEVPVVVREGVGDRDLLELALVENLQRADLNAIEEAEAFRNLQDRFGLTQDEVAERVGRARSTVTNSLRLLRLPPEVQDLLRGGELSAGQARPLLALDSSQQQVETARRAVSSGLSARQVERLVSRIASSGNGRKARSRQPDVHTAAAAEKLTRALQTRVEIRRRGKGGTVRLHFDSEEELMRIYDRIVGSSSS
ncbi:MAG: ParB/RepB/Spo0J family partition protein [Thermoanaerobaculia bacterium]|nr:ParB/RepB/Spo0J family partition protein [Thermoanaerobaculia bacterium]